MWCPSNRVSAKGRNPFFATWAFAGSGRWNCVLWHCCEEARTKFQGLGGRLDKSPVRRNAKRESGVELEEVRTRFRDFGKAPGQKTRSQVGREGMWCPSNRVSAKGRNPFFATWAFAGSGRWNCVLWHCCEEARTRFRDFGRGRAEKPRSPKGHERKWCTGNAQAAHRQAREEKRAPRGTLKNPKLVGDGVAGLAFVGGAGHGGEDFADVEVADGGLLGVVEELVAEDVVDVVEILVAAAG